MRLPRALVLGLITVLIGRGGEEGDDEPEAVSEPTVALEVVSWRAQTFWVASQHRPADAT